MGLRGHEPGTPSRGIPYGRNGGAGYGKGASIHPGRSPDRGTEGRTEKPETEGGTGVINLLLTLFWVAAALSFATWLYLTAGPPKAWEFASGYLIEKSLSIDNLFVFSLIFASYKFTPATQRRLLNWGIIGAIIFRGILISVGAGVVGAFHWVLYLFGAFLLYTAFKIFTDSGEDGEPGSVAGLRGAIARLGLNPYLSCILLVELCDVIFALDSIPATFAVTQDPFIVFTSNLFAILGLRSLYFVLLDCLNRFENLKYGVSAALGFIGVKILISGLWEIPTGISLAVIALILFTSTLPKGVFTHAENRD